MMVLQGNLNRYKAADSLKRQQVSEADIHIAIISEQYCNRYDQTWYADLFGAAAIWIVNSQKVPESECVYDNGYVLVKSKDLSATIFPRMKASGRIRGSLIQ